MRGRTLAMTKNTACFVWWFGEALLRGIFEHLSRSARLLIKLITIVHAARHRERLVEQDEPLAEPQRLAHLSPSAPRSRATVRARRRPAGRPSSEAKRRNRVLLRPPLDRPLDTFRRYEKRSSAIKYIHDFKPTSTMKTDARPRDHDSSFERTSSWLSNELS